VARKSKSYLGVINCGMASNGVWQDDIICSGSV